MIMIIMKFVKWLILSGLFAPHADNHQDISWLHDYQVPSDSEEERNETEKDYEAYLINENFYDMVLACLHLTMTASIFCLIIGHNSWNNVF